MKKKLTLLVAIIGICLNTFSQKKTSKAIVDSTENGYAATMLELYQIVYRPPATDPRQRVSTIRVKGGKLIITYLTCCSGQKMEVFDLAKIEPKYKVPEKESNTPEGRSAVIDLKTGKTIFRWLEKKSDAAMLNADLKGLKKHLAEKNKKP